MPGHSIAIRIWRESRGLDWQAIPLLADLHGVTDLETLVAELIAIREFMDEQNG